MREPVRIDSDLGSELRGHARRAGKTFEDLLDETLRDGLEMVRRIEASGPFVVSGRSLGLRPGLDYRMTSSLLDLEDRS